jgi:hypothetical protein
MNPRDLIDYAAQDDAVNFRASMYAAIHDKVTAAIENRKQDIAQGLLNQESVVNEGTMTHITLGKKVKNGDGGHDQSVHYKGEHIGSISSYSHRTGTRYGMEHKNGELSAGMRSPEEALDDLRSAHADHMRNMKESVVNEGTMTHITLGKKVKNGDGGHDQSVHYKGEHIGSISSYSHRTGTRYGMEHKNGELSAGMRSPEEALDDLRSAHADHMRNMKESLEEMSIKDEMHHMKKEKHMTKHGMHEEENEEDKMKKPSFPSSTGPSQSGLRDKSSSGGKTEVKPTNKPGYNSTTTHRAGNRYSGKY